MKNQKGFIVPLLLVIIAVLVIGGGYYFAKKAGYVPDNTPSDIIQPLNNSVSDWKIYKNEKYGFEFKYPLTWSLQEVEESPIPTQKRNSFAFKGPDTNIILFSISGVGNSEVGQFTSMTDKKLATEGDYTFVAHLPSAYVVPRNYEQEYQMLLSTFKFTK